MNPSNMKYFDWRLYSVDFSLSDILISSNQKLSKDIKGQGKNVFYLSNFVLAENNILPEEKRSEEPQPGGKARRQAFQLSALPPHRENEDDLAGTHILMILIALVLFYFI